MHTTGQTEAGLTQIAELESELSQLQSLNAKLEEDLRAGSYMGTAGNGHNPDDEFQPGFHGGCCCRTAPDGDTCSMSGASDSHQVANCFTTMYAYQHLIVSCLNRGM